MSETIQLVVLLGGSLTIFATLLAAVLVNRWRRTYGVRSARFVTASAFSNLSLKIAHLAAPGIEVFMPAGQGRYLLTLTNSRREKMELQLKQWLSLGMRYTVLITLPNEDTMRYWQGLVDNLPSGLNVFLLNRESANAEDAVEINRLDRFHPVLVFKGNEPLAMWIEASHDPLSNTAYNVEYVAREDIMDFQRERFFRFLRVMRHLTDESRHPPYLTRLTPKSERSRSIHSAAA